MNKGFNETMYFLLAMYKDITQKEIKGVLEIHIVVCLLKLKCMSVTVHSKGIFFASICV